MFEQITDNLFVLYDSGYGANSYLLIGKKVVLIDSGLASQEEDSVNFLKAAHLTPDDVDLVLHTHGHADHIGCSYLFEKAEKRMHSYDGKYVNLKDEMFTCSPVLDSDSFPKIDSFFEDGEEIDISPYRLKVFFTSGHTKGSVVFLEEKQKWLFSGDTLFSDNCGRFDLPTGNKTELIESLRKIQNLDFSLLLPGHGLIAKNFNKEAISAIISRI